MAYPSSTVLTMGSEELDIQCNQQPAAVGDSCDSSTAVGLASIPYQLAEAPSMSVAPTQASTPTPVTGGAAILAHSVTSHMTPHNVAVQPSVPPSPLPHVQVIQQPLQSQYLQHLYAPQQQHMFLPGNLTLQPAIQGIAGAPGLSLQLQGKTLDNKGGPAIISATPIQSAGGFSTQNLMSTGGQMITAGAKTCVQGQMLAATSKSTAVLQGQSTFIPSTTANQTVVIGQLGMLANQPSIIPHQAKAISDQKNKSYLLSQPTTLHPKSPILPSPNNQCAAGQMMANNQFKPAPHIISSQAPTMIASQAQILGSLQALGASLPQGITWATPGSLHSPALFGQNPIFIRSQQSDMLIQTPPPQQTTIHAVPVATAPPQAAPPTIPQQVPPPQPVVHQAAAVAPPPLPITPAPVQSQPVNVMPQIQKLKQVRPASSVATQTAASTMASAFHQSITKTQAKQRPRFQQHRSSPALSGGSPVTQHQTAATQTQTIPPANHKADAANQTKLYSDIRGSTMYTKSSGPDITYSVPEPKVEKRVVMQEVRPTIPSPVLSTNVAATSTMDIPIIVESHTVVEAEDNCMDVEEQGTHLISVDKANMMENGEEEVEHEEIHTNKMTRETVGIVAPLSETVSKEPTKQLQKAIVKPHVLTHVIEGFVIQEGSEPFPVSRPLMQNGTSSNKFPLAERNVTSNTATPPVAGVPAVPKKKEKMPKIRGPVELAKCEFCGKLGPKSKFKRSKRFCSTSCAKRYNAGCSKRHALTASDSDQKHSGSGKSAKKKKLGFKSKKSWKKSQNRSYEIASWVPPPPVQVQSSMEDVVHPTSEDRNKECNNQENSYDTSEVLVGSEVPVKPMTLSTCEDEAMEKDEVSSYPGEFATKPPVKWTVTDVVDFVKNLPGCSDYADEFRSQEIDGQALLLLKEDHLMSTMSMKLGPALKVCARINSLRDEAHH